MTAWCCALAAAWSVLHLAGVDRRWPWRVADLHGGSGPRRMGPTTPRRPERANRRTRHRAPVRRLGRRRTDAAADLVQVVDLLHVAVGAGHTVHTAVAQVSGDPQGPVAAALHDAQSAFARGQPLDLALAELPRRVGAESDALVAALVTSLHSGAPAGPALRRLADVQRRRRRRQGEARVRRLPVLLLAPLVGLVLPAFVLLALVPVGLTTARSGLFVDSAPEAPVPRTATRPNPEEAP